MSTQSQLYHQKIGLTIKDLIITGVFSAIIFVCIMLTGGPFAIMPALTFYFPAGSALLAGPVFLLLVAKVPKRGPITVAGLLAAVFTFATGMHWGMVLGYAAGGILADLVAGIKAYHSKEINILSYIVFCLGGTGSYLAYFCNPQVWMGGMLEKGTPQEYLDTMYAHTGWQVLVTMLGGTVLVALLSGMIGSRLLKKQFEKAGITA
ncbi:MAG: MptD family putative ECF transporter S component [Lachnospiraceae bacterium]